MVLVRAILAGVVGVCLLQHLGLGRLHATPTLVGAHLWGGLIFGVGMLLLDF